MNKIYIPKEIWKKRSLPSFANRIVSIKLENGDIINNLHVDNETGEIILQDNTLPKDDFTEAKDLHIKEESIIAIKEQTGILYLLTFGKWKTK